MKLNEMQKKAVYTKERFLFLLAGAGSGKTRVLVERIKYLINQGVEEGDILALTFTRKAAQEMRERVGRKKVRVHTFHQFCLQELKKEKTYSFEIFNPEVTHPFSERDLLLITHYKNQRLKGRKPRYYDTYQNHLKENKLKDFDDLLNDYYSYACYKRIKLKYIFVDEFQDTNPLQYRVLKSMIHENTSVFCVGDPDQSIYGFRGSDVKIIDQYVSDYHASIYQLTVNYRSSPTIIRHANQLIEYNQERYKKNLTSINEDETKTIHLVHQNETEEAEVIYTQVKTYINQGVSPNEIAILFRQNERHLHLKQHFEIHGFGLLTNTEKGTTVHFLTIHQAKGLEFEVVFIIGLEASQFPVSHTQTKRLLEEERRLMFVAMTRAKRDLIISSIQFNHFNKKERPSLFLKETGIKYVFKKQRKKR
ncbi:MAG: ATP-dependent helicase [Acholeplasmataceae bacterium]|nr:ATP-dependent helicase [Acholeplasmataceae bacterium]